MLSFKEWENEWNVEGTTTSKKLYVYIVYADILVHDDNNKIKSTTTRHEEKFLPSISMTE